MRMQKKRVEPDGEDAVLWKMPIFSFIQHFKGKKKADSAVFSGSKCSSLH